MGFDKLGRPSQPRITPHGEMMVKECDAKHLFTYLYDDAQSNELIITPTKDQKLIIRQVYVSTASDLDVKVCFDNGDPEDYIFVNYPQKRSSISSLITRKRGDIDQGIKLTCGADTFVLIAYDQCGNDDNV